MQFVGVKIPDALATLINEEVKRSGRTKTDVVKDAINQYFNVDIPEGSTLMVMDKNGLIELIDSRVGAKPEDKPEGKQKVVVVKREVEPEVKREVEPEVKPVKQDVKQEGLTVKPEVKSKVKPTIQRLSEDSATQEKIKELWRAGERNRQAIAQQVGYKNRTVQQYIKDCLESGELEK